MKEIQCDRSQARHCSVLQLFPLGRERAGISFYCRGTRFRTMTSGAGCRPCCAARSPRSGWCGRTAATWDACLSRRKVFWPCRSTSSNVGLVKTIFRNRIGVLRRRSGRTARGEVAADLGEQRDIGVSDGAESSGGLPDRRDAASRDSSECSSSVLDCKGS